MANITSIISAIDTFLESKNQLTTTPVEINPILEKRGLLNDSNTRPGLPLRKLLRSNAIPHAYKNGVNWHIPHSKAKILHSPNKNSEIANEIAKEKSVAPKPDKEEHKLKALADIIVELIEIKFKTTPSYLIEYKPEWLLSFPNPELLDQFPGLEKLYAELTENRFHLGEILSKLCEKQLKQKQSFDIWIGEPFNFAIEFDEKQHFNQYRKITLEYYDNIPIGFPLSFYKKLNKDTRISAGTSGFTRLKSFDPLFPEMFSGTKQDNRTRQRAFRDYLKDLLPIHFGYKPTLRIPYHITNKKINRFSDIELSKIRRYIDEYKLL